MPETIHAKVLCRQCRCIHPREYNQTEAFYRHVGPGEYLLTPRCPECVSAADRVSVGWWKPERSHLQPVNE